MKDKIFFNQSRLLLRLLPIINEHEVFALKGGTAINFFIRNFPRLSIDIDLTYLVIEERDKTLSTITTELLSIMDRIKKLIPGSTINIRKLKGIDFISGLIVLCEGVAVKIEPNTVIRGSIFEPMIKSKSIRQSLFLLLKTDIFLI